MVLDEENVKEQENQAEEGQKESNNDDCFRFNGDSIYIENFNVKH